MPLKVSDSLFAVARQEADATDRSITAQVEHWARIGRAVEALLAHEELLALKRAGELLTPVFPSAAWRRELHDLLTQVAASDREVAKVVIRASGKVRYAGDPAHPGLIVEVSTARAGSGAWKAGASCRCRPEKSREPAAPRDEAVAPP